MINPSLNQITKAIQWFGEIVSVVVYSSPLYSDYGDMTSATTTLSSVKAIFNTWGITQNFQPEGQFSEVRYSFFFDKDQSGIDIDNHIIRADGEEWKINKVNKHALYGNTAVQEAVVSNT